MDVGPVVRLVGKARVRQGKGVCGVKISLGRGVGMVSDGQWRANEVSRQCLSVPVTAVKFGGVQGEASSVSEMNHLAPSVRTAFFFFSSLSFSLMRLLVWAVRPLSFPWSCHLES